MSVKILFLVPYPSQQAPSQRFRFEQYLEILKKHYFSYTIKSFLSTKAWRVLYSNNLLQIIPYVMLGIIKRLTHLSLVPFYDYVFIHREVTPFGPPVFEWLIAKFFRKKIIYDFDDAIWLNDPEEEGSFKARIKWKRKVASICKWSYKISVGNQFLAEYALQFNSNVILNPTTIDTAGHHNPEFHKKSYKVANQSKFVIGWTGTHSTLPYLTPIIPIIKKLEKQYDFDFLVIANKCPDIKLSSFKFLPWSKSTEIEDLMQIDIGIMPLTHDQWSSGKCGFKALQYMALEIPALVSPVGANSKIVDHQMNGFICESEQDWENYLIKLLNNENLIREIGKNGREKVKKHYSVSSNQDNFLSLFFE